MTPRTRAVLVGVASLADITGEATIGELRRARDAGTPLEHRIVARTQATGFVAALAACALSATAALGAVPEAFLYSAAAGPVSFLAATVTLARTQPSAP